MNALSEAMVRVLRQQREFDTRLARIEAALSLTPPAQPSAMPQPPAPPPPSPATPVPSSAMAPPLPAPTAAPGPFPTAIPPAPERSRLETNIGLNLVNRIGVITLVLGVAFFFKWAVDNQWIGPVGRVALGILAGLATLAAGDFVARRNQRIFAQGVTGAGIAILYLSLYAAFGFYHLIPQALAFAIAGGDHVPGRRVIPALQFGGHRGRWSFRRISHAADAQHRTGSPLVPAYLRTSARPRRARLTRLRSWRLLERLAFAATMLLYWAWIAGRFEPHKEHPADGF